MEETRKPLIKKIYHERCPGCKQDQIKEAHRGIPYVEFLLVWIVVLCNALPISSLFPFIYFMIRDFHIAKREEDIGYYAGYVGSSFMMGRALTSVLWGVVADRYGRKPVILMGTISVVVLNTLFGLSSSFWMAIFVRFLHGCFNGLLGPVKAYVSEVCREEHQALGLSIVSTSWGMGLIIGPAIGGFLAQPAEKYPNLFPENSLFARFPYFLPCLCISLFAMASFIACCWMPETLHFHGKEDQEGCDGLDVNNEEAAREAPPSEGNLMRNWHLMSAIIVYCVFSLHDIAYTEVFSLWAVSDRKYGGLSFSSEDVGEVLAISGFGLLLFQVFVYPMVEKILGPIMVSRIAAVLSIPLLSSYPFLAILSGLSLTLLINCASLLKNIFYVVLVSMWVVIDQMVSIITGLFLLQNNAVPQHQRGAANGISLTAMSIFKTVGPAAGGALFAWAQKRQKVSFLPGDHMVFFMLNVVELIGVVLTFKPFLTRPEP